MELAIQEDEDNHNLLLNKAVRKMRIKRKDIS
jgi:hypothetical protein